MPVTDADVRAWSEKHGIVLSATPIENDTWRVEAKTSCGTTGLTVETDGSHVPDPFDCLFGSWADMTPRHNEYVAAAQVLGPVALAELALLVGWL